MVVNNRPGGAGRQRAAEIRSFLLANIAQHPSGLVRLTTNHFGVSRQTVNKQLGRLIAEGVITPLGKTKSRRYDLKVATHFRTLQVTPDLDEDLVWTQFAQALVADCPDNVQHICHYGFTEMLNNVKDHSNSALATVYVLRSAKHLEIRVFDWGVGIFAKIRDEFGLANAREAVFELSKGKLTTDPDRHTGEGIFFTSRMFDHFSILSGHLWLGYTRADRDWLLEDREKPAIGTCIFMEIDPLSTHAAREVFDHYATDQADYGFTKTHIVVKLAESPEERFVSRSQAKRIMTRLSKFQEVVLDFKGIESIGPAFADEIFRVYQSQHPEVSIHYVEAVLEIERMITKALNALQEMRESEASPDQT